MTYFGIINRSNVSVFITPQYQTLEDAKNDLLSVVKKWMDCPSTELIVSEDTAIVYFEAEGSLFVSEKIDIEEMLNEE